MSYDQQFSCAQWCSKTTIQGSTRLFVPVRLFLYGLQKFKPNVISNPEFYLSWNYQELSNSTLLIFALCRILCTFPNTPKLEYCKRVDHSRTIPSSLIPFEGRKVQYIAQELPLQRQKTFVKFYELSQVLLTRHIEFFTKNYSFFQLFHHMSPGARLGGS